MQALARSAHAAALSVEQLDAGAGGPDRLAEELMTAMARSVIAAVAFFELSGDDVVDPDSAVRAMENIAHELQGVNAAERSVLREALGALVVEEQSAAAPRQAVIALYKDFMEHCGLEEA
jgi:hypothetical protein